MTNIKHILLSVSLLTMLGFSATVSAQVGGINGPTNQPTISPYVNLLRQDGNLGLNYFGLVRPQLEMAQQNQMLGQDVMALQANQMQPGRMAGGYSYTQLGATGHPVMFGSINGGRFQGGYSGMAGGGMMGGGMQGGFGGGAMGGAAMGGFGGAGGGGGAARGGAMNGGFNPMGAVQLNGPGGAGNGFSGVSGHMAQFGGIGNQYRGAGQGQ